MKHYILLLLFSTNYFFIQAQNFHGKVVSSDDGSNLSYASIGILNKPLGTVSNEDGYFVISTDKIQIGDTLLIEHIGYLGRSIVITRENTLSSNLGTIYLSPESTLLPSVKIEKTKLKGVVEQFGNGEDGKYDFAVGIGGVAKGQESAIAIKTKNKKQVGILKNVTIGIATCNIPYKRFRLNIYGLKENSKLSMLNEYPTYFTVRPEHEKIGITIDLLEQNIEIKESFIIAIQRLDEVSPSESLDVTVFSSKDIQTKYPLLTRNGIGQKFDLASTRNTTIAVIAEVLY
ncbi:MAG: carboxypeptidase-like regulatory domain-containing protein [Saprospiraceae bacterium]|nr:carboxypeptidase-like regulatory domain-containing protein [Saprospiraceae bacterium]